MGQKVVIGWIGDGNAASIDLGFIPGRARLWEDLASTNPNMYEWSKIAEDNYSLYALKTNGADGVVSRVTTTAGGISSQAATAYERVKIPHPQTGEKVPCSVSDWATGTSYASGARSATAVGTVVRPPTHIHKVFELVTATGAGTSAPATWDVNPGETVTDGGSNVWLCRQEENVSMGLRGLVIGADIQTDAKQYLLEVEELDREFYAGNIDNYPGDLIEMNTRNTY